MKYIIQEQSKNTGRVWYVCSRPGFYRTADGQQIRDKSCPLTSAPEMSRDRTHAIEFTSHRAAMRVKSKCPSATVQPVL